MLFNYRMVGWKSILGASAGIPGSIYLGKEYLAPAIRASNFGSLAEEIFRDFGPEKIDNRNKIFQERDKKWIKIPGEENYDQVKSMALWQHQVDKYNGDPMRAGTNLYKFMELESREYDGVVRMPEFREYLDGIDLRRIMLVCKNLWSNVKANEIKTSAAVDFCTEDM